MRLQSLFVATLAALPFLTATATAQGSLSTVFPAQPYGAWTDDLYFDLDVTTPAISVTSVGLNLVGTGSVSFYTRTGTRLGAQTSPAGWTLVGISPVTNATAGHPTPIALPPFVLQAGVHGIAVQTSGGLSHYVTSGTLTSTTIARPEVTLRAGELTTGPFSGSVLSPWVIGIDIDYLVGGLIEPPPHASVYNGLSRGFNFTAATDFVIRQLDLPLDAKLPGDTASYLVRVNGSVAFHSVGNAGPVGLGVAVHVGDVVDVIGNWSAVPATSASAHNSYTASVAPYATTILGVPHTLQRCGWQWDIGAANWSTNGTTGAYLSPTGGAMGRVRMTVEPPVGGGNTVLGQGCGAQFSSIYESMTPGAFDLANSAITFTPTNTGSYAITRAGGLLPVGSVATPVVLSLGDDAEQTIAFSTGSFPGWSGLTICSNGFISKAVGNTNDWTPTVAEFLAAPQAAFRSWHDFDTTSGGSGQIKLEESPAVTVVTWDGVHTYLDPTPSTVQFQFYATGQVVIAFGSVSSVGTRVHLVGYSPGGASADPGAFDFSALGANGVTYTQVPEAPALQLTPTSSPVVGSPWNLQLDNVPAATVLGVDIVGLSDPGILDLAFLGLPGCQLRASLDSLNPWLHGPSSGSTHTWSLGVPPLALLGIDVYATSATFTTQPNNPFGAYLSNGVRGTIGNN
ncbi:MAG: hypothetical protein JNK15_12465 [Planctomycetes bacterium]|nr:hypothetical protein [Planctomycetota bacterium]